MKKLLCLLIPILGLLSCSNELEKTQDMAIAMSNESISLPSTEKTKTETDISNYITKIKLGNTSAFSRTSNNYSLTPYIYEGDTIMYIANYASGWELYSADQRTPLIMASSETGSFDINDNTMAPAFKSYLNSVAEELYQIKQMDTTEGETYGLWKTVSIQNDEVDQQMIEVAPRAAGTQPGSGYWVLLSTTTPVTSTNTSNRLTSTRWGQGSPWNAFVPFVQESTTQHSLAGCAAVATAQYLYCLHYKNNKPANTVTTATYLSANNRYNYTGSSSAVWDQMAKTSSASGTNQTAIFIGYVGQKITTEYGNTVNAGSGANINNVINFINSEGNYNYQLSSMNYTYIINELKAGRAVYARSDAAGQDAGHQFIIDRYRATTTSSTSTFGWVGTDNYGQDTNEYDENGNIVGYSFFYDKENTSVSYTITMNWGWDGSSNDNMFFTATDNSDWNVDIYHFNTNRQFLK
ncbi:MAG: C10 family peptidase [Parabacteroides sp.]|nr:C10 family peptidase [Parabacteroides sp.]